MPGIRYGDMTFQIDDSAHLESIRAEVVRIANSGEHEWLRVEDVALEGDAYLSQWVHLLIGPGVPVLIFEEK